MPGDAGLPARKSDHIRINLEEDVRSGITTGLEKYHFIHQALPELNLDEIDLSQKLFGKVLKAPILISSMTGGTKEAASINRVLAECAQKNGLAMGLGSQRAAIEHPELAYTYQIRKIAPDILLFANLGAIQLNYSYTLEHCKRAIDMVEADALILHLNALQEALQPEGDTRFGGLINKIEMVCRHLNVPVIAKEVGWGLSQTAARLLENAGVAAIDVAGAGGTSWSQVEMYRNKDEHQARIAAVFRDWGISTSDSIQTVHAVAPEMVIFASGGLRNGIDIAKCIALGARLGGIAGPFLKSAIVSIDETLKVIDEIQQEMAICMFAVGAANLAQLQLTTLIKDPGR
ncbi:MAG TPA: type 2 isopentenyl-diphosphate Delta-isomerase [Anaerolineaceae bacterium]|nr:type 2 isopentenyl-diphosphate Delta-isomerase [Anaerolineaceae bacterium]